MPDFLLELRCEEIPARMQAGARGELERLFRRELEAAGITHDNLRVWSTPRRLALIAYDLPAATEAVSEEAKGPPEGAPDAALDGFCRKNGVTRDQLELRDVKGRNTWFAVIEKPGRAVKDVLAAAIPAIVRDFSWPKSMRWGAASLSTESLRWVRPLSGIVTLLDGEVVDVEVGDIRSGRETMGHRFHHSGPIAIESAHTYASQLLAARVIVEHTKREGLIRQGAADAAAAAGLTLVEDEGLVIENAGLTEYPVPLLGRFDEAFLDVPPEVIQLTARTNQKYFVCHSFPSGKGDQASLGGRASDGPPLHHPADGPPPRAGEERMLANAFVCTANIEAADGGAAIVDGNRKVLAARLSDARFFWEQDRKTPLAEHAKKLERITFHEKLGTVADKVERVAKLARWLVEEGIVNPPRDGEGDHAQHGGGDLPPIAAPAGKSPPSAAAPLPPPRAGEDRARLADLAEAAARLCKADLVTEMVGEFPELQGLMGGYYARAEGLPDEVADAIRDHYKPVGQGDDVPTAPVTVAVSLADKLDTLVGFFAISERPTGSKDPYALRRAAVGAIRLIFANDVRVELAKLGKLTGVFMTLERGQKALLEIGRRFDFSAPGANTDIDFSETERAILYKGQRFELPDDIYWPLKFVADMNGDREEALGRDLFEFFVDRLKVQQREAGVRHDLIDAVFALGGEDDLVRLLARVHALQAFMATEDGANLLAGYKRAANILKKEGWDISVTPAQAGVQSGAADTGLDSRLRGNDPVALSYTPEPAEKALMDALATAEPQAANAIASEDFAAAMAALASLRAPIDRFFEEVTVNADEENKRTSRLALLARLRGAVHNVADFSRIEG